MKGTQDTKFKKGTKIKQKEKEKKKTNQTYRATTLEDDPKRRPPSGGARRLPEGGVEGKDTHQFLVVEGRSRHRRRQPGVPLRRCHRLGGRGEGGREGGEKTEEIC